MVRQEHSGAARALTRLLGLSVALLACGCAPPRELPPAQGPAPVAHPAEPQAWLNQMMELAPSNTGKLPVRGLPMIVLTERELRLVGAERYALPLPPRAAWSRGFPASEKRGGLYLFRFGRWLARTHRPGGRDIDLMVDRAIPYQLFIETLATAGRSGYQRFHLIVRTHGEPAQIVIRLPQRAEPERASIALTVARDGVTLLVPAGNVAPGCAGLGPGAAVSRLGGNIDEPALESCLGTWTGRNPGLRAVRIAAAPGVAFGQIVRVLDAVRSVSELHAVEFALPVGIRAGS